MFITKSNEVGYLSHVESVLQTTQRVSQSSIDAPHFIIWTAAHKL